MKTAKKVSALFLALVLTLALIVVPAGAEGGTITIENTVSGATYQLYQMFDIVTIEDGGTTYYYYRPTASWVSFFTSGNGGLFGKYSTETGYINWTDTNLFSDNPSTSAAQIATFTKHAEEYAATLMPDATASSTGTSLTVDNLNTSAYYLVNSSLGSAAIAGPVDSTGSLVISEKNDVSETPTLVKLVDGAEYKSVDMGAEFTYQVTATMNEAVVKGADGCSITLTDVVPPHIAVTEGSMVLSVTSGGSTTVLTADQYEVLGRSAGSDSPYIDSAGNHTYVVKVKESLNKGDVVTFEYKARLVAYNGVLPAALEMYSNLVTLSYGDVSIIDTATVFTFVVNVYKYYQNDQSATIDLPDAEFKLKNSEGKWYHYDDATNTVSWVDDAASATAKVSDASGDLTFFGIATGDYTLVETKAPDGYTGAGETSVTVDRYLSEVRVENTKGTSNQLPETGGVGTIVFYVLGGALVLAALVVLITKKRMSSAK